MRSVVKAALPELMVFGRAKVSAGTERDFGHDVKYVDVVLTGRIYGPGPPSSSKGFTVRGTGTDFSGSDAKT